MKILVDTNVMISAMLYPGSKPAKALFHVADNHELVLSDHNITEFHRIARDKLSKVQADIDCFLTELSYELIHASEESQKLIADPMDAPILNAALHAEVDVIISGDKHFLSLDIEKPIVQSVATYLDSVETEEPQ